MHTPKAFRPKIRLCFRSGGVFEFESIALAAQFARKHGLLERYFYPGRPQPIGTTFGVRHDVFNPGGHPNVIAQTEHGDPVEISYWTWRELWGKKPSNQPERHRGSKRGYGCRRYRRPQSQSIIRGLSASEDHAEDHGLDRCWIGGVRKLRTGWDDTPRSRVAHRNWKQYRDHQWKD